MNLHNFQEQINETIKDRGLGYYRNDRVESLIIDEVEQLYKAQVYGSDFYDVEVKLDGEDITYSHCSCPYDWGPYCKHEVAVFCAIRDALRLKRPGRRPKLVNFTQIQVTRITAKDKAKEKKEKKAKKNQLKEIVQQMDRPTLEKLVLTTCKKDKDFEFNLLYKYSHLITSQDYDYYVNLVQKAIKEAQNKHKEIKRKSVNKFEKKIKTFSNEIRTLIEAKQYEKAFMIVQVLIEQLIDVEIEAQNYERYNYYYDDYDESDQLISDIFHTILNEDMIKLVKECKDKKLKKTIFDYLRKELLEDNYFSSANNYDLHHSAAWVMVAIIGSKTQEKAFFEFIDKLLKLEVITEEQYLQLHYDLLMGRYTEKEREAFLSKHLKQYDYFLQIAIQTHLQKKQAQKAVELIEEKIARLKKEKRRGYDLTKWNEQAYQLYHKLEDKNKIVEFAQELFLEDNNMDYYHTIKENTLDKDWEKSFAELIKKLKKGSGKIYNQYIIADLYLEENKYQKLYNYLMPKADLDVLNSYDKQLIEIDGAAVERKYEKLVRALSQRTSDRTTYKEIATHLKRMRELYMNLTVDKLLEEFREKYKIRRAMMQELKDV